MLQSVSVLARGTEFVALQSPSREYPLVGALVARAPRKAPSATSRPPQDHHPGRWPPNFRPPGRINSFRAINFLGETIPLAVRAPWRPRSPSGSGPFASASQRRTAASRAPLSLFPAREADPHPDCMIEPMTLANMRENGVRSLDVGCHQCHHETLINVDHLSGDLTVPSFGACKPAPA
jgi:hypothetical protein